MKLAELIDVLGRGVVVKIKLAGTDYLISGRIVNLICSNALKAYYYWKVSVVLMEESTMIIVISDS